MHESFNTLCEKMPNTIGNLQSLVNRIDTSMKDLLKISSETSAELDKAEDFKSFCQAVEDLRLVIICNCFSIDVTVMDNGTSLIKVKVVPYTFVHRGVPVREGTYPEPSAYEVGLPVPFLVAFISPVLPPGTHLLLGEQ